MSRLIGDYYLTMNISMIRHVGISLQEEISILYLYIPDFLQKHSAAFADFAGSFFGSQLPISN